MARRPQRIVERIAEAASRLPWQMGVVLAAFSSLLVQWWAASSETPIRLSQKIAVPAAGVHGISVFLGIFLPMVFLAGAAVSWWKRYKRARLYGLVARSRLQNPFNNLSWPDFEFLVGEHFRHLLFSVDEAGSGTGGGIDLVARKSREAYLIRCEHLQTENVGVETVREVFDVVVSEGATGGIVVTSGACTEEATAFAKANNIQILDREGFLRSLQAGYAPDHRPEKEHSGKLKKTVGALLVIGAIALAASFFDSRNSTVSFLENLSSFVLKTGRNGERTQRVGKTPSGRTGSTDMQFTDAQVKTATEELLREKRRERVDAMENEGQADRHKYVFRIELVGGGSFFTDNASVTEHQVVYKDRNGLVVSLNRDQVKSVKKIDLGK